jgi:hypothetical protein
MVNFDDGICPFISHGNDACKLDKLHEYDYLRFREYLVLRVVVNLHYKATHSSVLC